MWHRATGRWWRSTQPVLSRRNLAGRHCATDQHVLLRRQRPRRVDDYRGEVHDSDGLSIWRATGEALWRPLVNPTELRVSVFADENPRGFGLLQRGRSYQAYGDLDARFDQRPNLWVEPKGAWGAGSVRLIEIPIQDETHDNIVAFWTPQEPVNAGHELRVAYSLLWSLQAPLETGLMAVLSTHVGLGGEPGADRPDLRKVAIEFAAPGSGIPGPCRRR